MLALLLAVAATTITADPRPEKLCDEHDLLVMISAPASESAKHRMEVDRRAAAVLAEERRAEAVVAQGMRRDRTVAMGIAGAALIALLGAIAGRRRPLLAPLAGVITVVAVSGALLLGRNASALRARVSDLKDCRLRIIETREALNHGELARCAHDFDEMDEDLMLLHSKVSSGGAITADEIAHLRKEIAKR